jgi:hypothetical protein
LSTQTGVRIGVAVAMLLSAGCVDTEPSKADVTKTPISTSTPKVEKVTNQPTSTPLAKEFKVTPTVTPIPTQKPTETLAPKFTETEVGGVVFQLDSRRVPVSYRLPDGQLVEINQQELDKVRQQASINREPEVFKVIKFTSKEASKFNPGTKEHPVAKALPADVLSPEQLKKYGVEIVQPDNTELFIRKGAFEPMAPLADYASGKDKLKIVLLNAPLLHEGYFQDPKFKDPKYNGVAETLDRTKVDVEAYRQQKLAELQQELNQYREKGKGREDHSFDDSIVQTKIKIATYKALTADELFLAAYANELKNEKPKAGVYAGDLIVVSVGDSPSFDSVVVLCDNKGNFIFTEGFKSNAQGLSPTAGQSYPDPDSFKRDPKASHENGRYSYSGQAPGLVLRHEIAHDNLEVGSFKRLKAEDFKKPDGIVDEKAFLKALISSGNVNEYDTDEKAMGGIRQAWQRWKDSGYKDDKGYSFVFRVPGGYILTDTKSPTSKI